MAGKSVFLARFGGQQSGLPGFGGSFGGRAAAGGGLKVDQRVLYLAHGGANPRLVKGGGFCVAGFGGFDIGGTAAPVIQRQRKGQWANRPGRQVCTDTAAVDIERTDGAIQAEARVLLGLAARDVLAGSGNVTLGCVQIRPLIKCLRRDSSHGYRGFCCRGSGCEFLFERRFGQAGERDQRLDAAFALGGQRHGLIACLRGHGIDQRLLPGRGKTSPGGDTGQPGGFGFGGRIPPRQRQLHLTGAVGDVLVGHFSGHRNAGIVPAGLGAGQPLGSGVFGGAVGTKQVNFPTGHQAQLNRVGGRGGGEGGGLRAADAGRSIQRGTAGRLGTAGAGTGLRNARGGGGQRGVYFLCGFNQFDLQLITLAQPPVAQVGQLAVVRQRGLPGSRGQLSQRCGGRCGFL